MRVSVHVCSQDNMDFINRNFKFETMPFPELVQAVFGPPSDRRFYLRSLGANARKEASDIAKTFPSLASEFRVPDVVLREVCEKEGGQEIRESACLSVCK